MRFIKKHTIASIFCLILGVAPAFASSGNLELKGDFEGNGKVGVLTYSSDSNEMHISYRSPSLNRSLSYVVKNFDECSMMGLSIVPYTGMLDVDGSCASQGGQIYRYIYQWSKKDVNWCLIRQITGEKSDITSGAVVATEAVSRASGCSPLGVTDSLTFESKDQVRRDIGLELEGFRKIMGNAAALKSFIVAVPDFQIAELASYIDSADVEDVNNMAFYLVENGRSDDAIPVLRAIIDKFPTRVVARLNLADAYWSSDDKELAISQYKEYVKQMNGKGLSKKIPPRVFVRIK
ncbi:tetratricopeptide repeat protein [Burkholderia cepacia]|uniref:tetratricopeptide repeat protein n=1 Tax=Burkholderia cepacia TaxID=292 RepID=UPI000AF97671|nr:tetratricopeptide repeat protein [Burkholderia cepacia]